MGSLAVPREWIVLIFSGSNIYDLILRSNCLVHVWNFCPHVLERLCARSGVCVRVLDVLLHDIFAVLWTRLLDLMASLAHHIPDKWSRTMASHLSR